MRVKNETDRFHIVIDIIKKVGMKDTKEGKKIIMCVMKKRFASLVLEAVKELDPGAFMIVSDASEIYGNGYKSYNGGNMG